MSDLEESWVTYTDISSPFEELSDIGSPRADDNEYLLMLEDPYVEVALQAPPSPDYMPGPEEPEQAPPSPDYILGPEHANDEIVTEDQPYAEDASPIAQSPEYVPESDFEMHLEDDDDEDPEEDHVNYPADGGDDGDDEEEISIPTPVHVPAWSDSEVVRLLAMSSPPSSPLSPWSSPPPQIPFPPLPPILSPPSPVLSSAPPPSPIQFKTRVRKDTNEIYMWLDDEQSERQLLAGRLNLLFRDTHAHAYIRHLMEIEARLSRDAWVRSTDASDLVRGTDDSPTGIGDSFAGIGYRITGTAGTRGRSYTTRATRGGW
nr:hypothetical protein [Tanacetum cinerariifolium]